MQVFKVGDCQNTGSLITALMQSYENYVLDNSRRVVIDHRLNTVSNKIGDYTFVFLSNMYFSVINHYKCFLGWVEDSGGHRQRRWWWKSGSCGTWRAGIKFELGGWTAKGIYKGKHKISIKEKLYKEGLGYINETQVCAALQTAMDAIDLSTVDYQVCLNEQKTPRYIEQILNLAEVPAYRFLKHVVGDESVKAYNQAGTTPRYFDVATVNGRKIDVDGTYFPISATDRNKEIVCSNIVNGLEIWDALVEGSMSGLNHGTASIYTINTEMVKDADVWKFDVPITVSGANLNTLTYEVACSRAARKNMHQQTKHTDGQHTDIYCAWIKQCYLHPQPNVELVTSFGNNGCFSKNLVGIIQKSADYIEQTGAIDEKYKGIVDPNVDKYQHLSLWNEKTSVIVREFKKRTGKSSYYDRGIQEFKNEYRLQEKDITRSIKDWLLEACEIYLDYHENPKTWSVFGHNESGVNRVKEIKVMANKVMNLDAIDLMFFNLITNKTVNNKTFSGDPCATRQTSFFPIFLGLMSIYALNSFDRAKIADKIKYYASVANDNHKILKFITKDLKKVGTKNYAGVVSSFKVHYV